MAEPGEEPFRTWLRSKGANAYREHLKEMGANTVDELSTATVKELMNAGIPRTIANTISSAAKRNTTLSNYKIVNAEPGSAALPAALRNPFADHPTHGILPRDPQGAIESWPHFRNVSRAQADALLANQPNTFMVRKSSLFPNNPTIFVLDVNMGTHIHHSLIKKDPTTGSFVYINENQGLEIAPTDPNGKKWSQKQFGGIIFMVKARFGNAFQPAILPRQGGRRKRQTRRCKAHTRRTKRKH